MEDQLITFETAKLAKEKGFNIDCSKGFYFGSQYEKDGEEIDFIEGKNIIKDRESPTFEIGQRFIYRPTKSELQKWIREVHKLIVIVSHEDGYDKELKPIDLFCFSHIKSGEGGWTDEDYFNTYEEALEKGLFEALKSIKKEMDENNK